MEDQEVLKLIDMLDLAEIKKGLMNVAHTLVADDQASLVQLSRKLTHLAARIHSMEEEFYTKALKIDFT